MSKITVALLLGCMLILLASTAHAVPTGVIYDAGLEGVITPDGGGPGNDNYDWTFSQTGAEIRTQTTNSINWGLTNTEGSQGVLFESANAAGACEMAENGWYNGSGHGSGDILMAPNTTYVVTVDYSTYGALFNGGGTNSTDWLGIGYNIESGDSFYWNGRINTGSYNAANGLNWAKVVDYATGANVWQTASFVVSNTTSANESVVTWLRSILRKRQ